MGEPGNYPEAYKRYLEQFHKTRDFFECHEILEEYWKNKPDDPFGDLWVGLIQLAVGLYHHRRGNATGAVKMLRGARGRLSGGDLASLGIDGKKLLELVEDRLHDLEKDPAAAYRDLDIPLADDALVPLTLPKTDSSRLGPDIIDRHLLRDRTDVVEARLAALRAKREASKQGIPNNRWKAQRVQERKWC